MNIMPVRYSNHTNFSGIQKFSKLISGYDDTYRTFIDDYCYEYYPFLDESEKTINNVKKAFNYSLNLAYCDHIINSQVEIKDKLPITKKEYEALKKEKLSDDSILEIFA